MKTAIITLTFLFIFLFSCSIEEDYPIGKPYPLLITLSPIDNNESGVTMRAELTNNHLDKITHSGFGLIHNGDTSIYNVSNQDQNIFSLRLNYDLTVGETYDYYGFVITDKYKVRGSLQSFICQGVSQQNIKDFYPKEGPDNSIITIVGNNFRSNPQEVTVKLNEMECPVIHSSKDTVKILVPPSAYYGSTTLSVEINGVKVNATDKFIVLGPEILSISNDEGYPGYEVEIYGKNFKANSEDVIVSIGQYQANVIVATDTYIKIELPVPGDNVMDDYYGLLSIKNALKVAKHDQPLTMKKTWNLIGSIPFLNRGYRYNVITYNDKAYIIRYQYYQMMQIDPELNNWTEVSKYPGERHTPHPLHVVGNYMYIFDGRKCCSSEKDEVLRYDFLSSTWQVMKPTPISYDWSMTSFVYDNYIYFLHGSGDLWKYDPVIDEYEFVGTTALSGIRVFSFVLNGVIYAVTPGKTWQFNALAENWKEIAQNDFTKETIWQAYHMGSFVMDNKAYLMYDGKIYQLKPETGKWLHVSNWPQCVYVGPTFNVGEKLYMLDIETYYGCPDQNMYEFIYKME